MKLVSDESSPLAVMLKGDFFLSNWSWKWRSELYLFELKSMGKPKKQYPKPVENR